MVDQKLIEGPDIVPHDGVTPATPITLPSTPAHYYASNEGAAIEVVFVLPTGVRKMVREIHVVENHNVKIQAPAGVVILFGRYGPSASGGFVRSTPAGGSACRLTCLSPTKWTAFPISGAWDVDVVV